ncbi:hypothetical protein [Caviibacterium pharyngocola]|uniref:Uncharacterized protein n=1 Tax=Caviibacterium pharyngocola TaxID=28159 RepID=A0A2M8RW29_9PAST|nr:hypothetical protein [Caviibacterium pharyngocola]PJG83097.1 hypothetical protein CVP04_07020 [Caviibacterium pharyngocola]
MKIFAILTALLGVFSAQSLWAHSLYLFAQYDGSRISGKAYYSDMTPAAETYIEAHPQGNDQQLIEGKTDLDGRFSLPANGDYVYKVIIEGAEGHKASVIADRVIADRAKDDQIQDNALMLVREDIARLKDKMYLHDILGGIGYIFGIIGLWALWTSRSNKSSQNKDNQ